MWVYVNHKKINSISLLYHVMAKIIQGKTLTEWVVHFAKKRKDAKEITVILKSRGFETNPHSVGTIISQAKLGGVPLPGTKEKRVTMDQAIRLGTIAAEIRRIILRNPDSTYDEVFAIARKNRIRIHIGTIKAARQEMVRYGLVPEYVRESSKQPLELTDFQQKKFDEKAALIQRSIDDAGRRLPGHLRDDFGASARIVAVRAVQKYDPKKGNLDNYLGRSIRTHVMKFLSDTTRVESGVPRSRIAICLRAEKIAWELIAGGESKNMAFEKGIRRAVREYKAKKPNSKITSKGVQQDMLAIRAARNQPPVHLLRGESGRYKEMPGLRRQRRIK